MTLEKEFSDHVSVNHGHREYAYGEAPVNTAESFNAILGRAKQGGFILSVDNICRAISVGSSFAGTTGVQ
ncbi:hypothetical protein [Malonomonas rubra]|uniref:hypothetical protein n=1 Tax=Malonomonas rubra TaxID=57040 RepID=UPI0026F1350A|nr:hypothetical protein [Malonomonas rubra]